MQYITDQQVRQHMTHTLAYDAMKKAFDAYGNCQASNLSRSRTHLNGLTLSGMGAIMPELGLMGMKVYPTIAGQFNFLIALFSTHNGTLVAVMEGNALTEFRTANVTLLAAKQLANPKAHNLCIFGSGVQAQSHLHAFLPAYSWNQVFVVDEWGQPQNLCDKLSKAYDLPIKLSDAKIAVQSSDIIITATRSKTPLFDGHWVQAGSFVAAIGSSKPDTREIDDTLLQRSACIAVEAREQALSETGDFVMANRDVFNSQQVVELGELVSSKNSYLRKAQDITLYKSVGIGLEDVALAACVLQQINAPRPN
jgi:ornithine cyclodeaminase